MTTGTQIVVYDVYVCGVRAEICIAKQRASVLFYLFCQIKAQVSIIRRTIRCVECVRDGEKNV